MEGVRRPQPPASIFDADAAPFAADPECGSWIRSTFIEPDGPLYNEDHQHLQSATIGILWTTIPLSRHMMVVAGQAEIPQFQGNGWARGRQEQQMVEWFGLLPDFVITLDAEYAAACEDATWCALVEHELYHCGQEKDEFGGPKFRKSGLPAFGIRGHDVEQFIGVVRRYGANAAGVSVMIEAAKQAPLITAERMDCACGTCNRSLLT